jgi:hypothetical protein
MVANDQNRLKQADGFSDFEKTGQYFREYIRPIGAFMGKSKLYGTLRLPFGGKAAQGRFYHHFSFKLGTKVAKVKSQGGENEGINL